MTRKSVPALALALLVAAGAVCSARAANVTDDNPVFNRGAGIVVGAPTGGQLGPGTGNFAEGVYLNGVPVGGGLAVPNSCVIGGTGTTLSTVTLGSNLSCIDGTLNATGGASLPTSAPLVGSNSGGSGITITPANGLTISGSQLVPTFGTGANTFTQGNDSRLNVFTSGTPGIVGASGGGTSAFLRADGSWATPSGSGNVTGPGSSTAGHVATFNGTSGTLLQDGGALGALATQSTVALSSQVTGNLSNANLATQTANTLLGALTATTPSGMAVPSCSGASNALTWTSGTGFGCNTISGGGSPGGSSAYVQFNNAGSFGGTSALTVSGSQFTLAGDLSGASGTVGATTPLSSVAAQSGTITGSVSAVVLSTATAQLSAAFNPFLPFNNPSAVIVGSTVTGTDIAANSVVQYVSGGTASVVHTAQFALPSGRNYGAVAVESNSGIYPGMVIYDSAGGLDGSALVAGVMGVSTPYTLLSPTNTAGLPTITVASGGASCAPGSLLYDTTNTSAWPNGVLVNIVTATTVQVNNNSGSGGVSNTDTVVCYPQVIFNAIANSGGVTLGDTLTFWPTVSLDLPTSSPVPNGTSITFTPPVTSLLANGTSLGGHANVGAGGLTINGKTGLNITNGLVYQDVPGSDVLLGLGAGAALGPGDALTTAVGWKALGSLITSGSESTAFGYGAGNNLVSGGYVQLFGIGPLFSCTYGCNHIIAMGGDAMRNSVAVVADVGIGNSVMLNYNGQNSVGVGEGAVLQGQVGGASTGSFDTAVGYNTMSSSSMTTANDDSVFGANAGKNLTTGYGNFFGAFESGQAETTGFYNVAIGVQAMLVSSGSNNDVVIGRNAGDTITAAGDETLVGALAGHAITTGASNTCLGYDTCSAVLSTGVRNIVIGVSSFADTASSSTSDSLVIADGNTNSTAWITGIGGATTNPQITLPGSLVVGAPTGGNKGAGTINATAVYVNGGSISAAYLGTSTSATAPSITGDGTSGFYTAAAAQINAAISGSEVMALTGSALNLIGTDFTLQLGGLNAIHFPSTDSVVGQSVAIGPNTLINESSLTSTAFRNTAVGYYAMRAASQTAAAVNDTAVGAGACSTITSGTGDVCLGANAGLNITSGFYTIAIGSGALTGSVGTPYTGNNTVAIGYNTTVAATGSDLTVLGSQAANAFTTASYGAIIGALACQYCTSPNHTVAVGYESMQSVSGTPLAGAFNTAVGDSSGAVLQGAAQHNALFGYAACLACTTASGDTVLGYDVASVNLTTGANDIYIGVSSAIDAASGSESNVINIGGTGGSWVKVIGTGTQTTQAATVYGTLTLPNVSTSGTIAGAVCMTSGELVLYESGASGCTISLEELKNIHGQIAAASAEHDIEALRPIDFTMKAGGREQLGFGARQVNSVNAKLSTYDGTGALQAFDPNGILAELVVVVQRQQREIEELKAVRLREP
jgi:hypothetical protein